MHGSRPDWGRRTEEEDHAPRLDLDLDLTAGGGVCPGRAALHAREQRRHAGQLVSVGYPGARRLILVSGSYFWGRLWFDDERGD